jgi:NTP pyrophosphatase (non-canonical NTP hydrolase)
MTIDNRTVASTSNPASGAIGWVAIPKDISDPLAEILPKDLVRYDDFVELLFRKDPDSLRISHALIGLAGEVGELCDPIKANIFYGRELNLSNIVEEIGDIRFYLQAIMNHYKIGEQQVLQYNAMKLHKRYGAVRGFTTEAANARADKSGE